jgi:hypothetical protein
LKLTKLGARELTLDADADALAITLALEYINQGSIDGRVDADGKLVLQQRRTDPCI